jgi:hypothetical protein
VFFTAQFVLWFGIGSEGAKLVTRKHLSLQGHESINQSINVGVLAPYEPLPSLV